MSEIIEPADASPPDRRGFIKRVVAFVIGGVAMIPPLAAGVAMFLDPLRRRAGKSVMIPVASLASLPEDGSPRKFSVLKDHEDAWNRTANVPVGAVYLRRVGGDKVQALNVACPHAGCFVRYEPGRKGYLCPCHNSTFGLDGSLQDAHSPSPRALDELEVEIKGSEIWVRFESFRAGVAQKIPAS